MTTKKKVIVLISMALLLVVTTTLNIVLSLNRDGDDTLQAGGGIQDYYAAHRAQKQSDMDSLMLYYDSIINNESLTDTTAKQDAAAKKLQLLDIMQKESTMESAIKLLGYSDCVVTIDATGNNVYVVVKSAALETAQLDEISAVVCDADPSISLKNIRIGKVA